MKESIKNIFVSETLGLSWMAISKQIMKDGYPARYDGAPIKEIANSTLVTLKPDSEDSFIKLHGDPEWLAWMHENFFSFTKVRELGDAASYATRLFNYSDSGRDQIQWVVERLKKDKDARSATITTFQTLTDTTYIPCISLLDFWIPKEELELVVYAHSLDFGKKAYGNLIELATLQKTVAEKVDCSVGKLIIYVKTAHIYKPEWDYMNDLFQNSDYQN
jgi:thymidylate synthase